MGESGSKAQALSRCSSAILLAYFLLGWQTAARAQTTEPAAASEDVPHVTVGEVTGIPGAIVLVPLYYTPDPNISLRTLTVEIDYVSISLQFQSVASGFVTEKAGADVEAILSEGAPEDQGIARSKLRVMVSLTDKQPSKGLPGGLLAYLTFRISTDAKPFAIKLNPFVVSAEEVRDSLQKITKVHAQPGTVVVQVGEMTPLAGCFFFMH